MMPWTVRVLSTLRKMRSSSGVSRILFVELAALRLAAPSSPSAGPTSISPWSTTGRNTMSIEGIFFSMIGHSSTILMPSIRMKSALRGEKLSRSHSTVSAGAKWYSPSRHRKTLNTVWEIWTWIASLRSLAVM